MKKKHELESLIEQIARADSPVGMDAVYVHALILDKLQAIEQRLERMEQRVASQMNAADTGSTEE